MTLTITPQTEAMLLAKAERDGEDINTVADVLLADMLAREQEEEIAALRVGLASSDAGRVRLLAHEIPPADTSLRRRNLFG